MNPILRRAKCGLGALALLLVAGVAHANSATEPAPKNEEWWQARHAQMNERIKQGNADLLFIGDSITHGWEGEGAAIWEQFYAPRNAVNLGIGGDQTQHVLWRLENGNIAGVSPRAFASNFPLTGLAAEALKEMLPQESWRNCAHETCLADRCPKRQDRLRTPEIPPFAPDASADLPFLSVRICEDLWENILFGQCHVQFNCKEERN